MITAQHLLERCTPQTSAIIIQAGQHAGHNATGIVHLVPALLNALHAERQAVLGGPNTLAPRFHSMRPPAWPYRQTLSDGLKSLLLEAFIFSVAEAPDQDNHMINPRHFLAALVLIQTADTERGSSTGPSVITATLAPTHRVTGYDTPKVEPPMPRSVPDLLLDRLTAAEQSSDTLFKQVMLEAAERFKAVLASGG